MGTRLLPPEHLLQDCPYPEPRVVQETGDIVKLLPDWKEALNNCNADKAALRAWSKEQP